MICSRSRVRLDPRCASLGVSHDGFTIVEMLVVAVLIAILASLSLSGLAIARQRARIDKTRTTIRKLNEVIVPHYDSYLDRRVPFTSSSNARNNARNRLRAIRELMVYEMPDSWADVPNGVAAVTVLNASCQTGPVLAYAATKQASSPSADNGSAECLYMIVSRGGIDTDQMSHFRADEIGDVDKDGAPEFLDGFGRPIEFFRWAPGVASPVQPQDPLNFHDPFDPQRVDMGADTAAYALVPLIVSGGVDRIIGLVVKTGNSWSQEVPANPGILEIRNASVGRNVGAPISGSSAHIDNITNHDLIKK